MQNALLVFGTNVVAKISKVEGETMTFKFWMRVTVIATAALSFSSGAEAGPAEDAQAAFSKFFPAFVAYNQAEVAAMFAPDAQFYRTISPELVTKPEGVLKYFTAALDRPDITKATPLQLNSTALSDNVVSVAGMWQVERTLDGKTTGSGPLRVTAVLQKRNDRWLVVQFHNSPRPAPPSPQPAAAKRKCVQALLRCPRLFGRARFSGLAVG
jgi:hypothetical protein